MGLFRKVVNGTVTCHFPDLVLYELGNVLVKRSENPESKFRAFLRLPIGIHEAKDIWLIKAFDLQRKHRISFYDAVFVALARHLDVPFLTADERLARSFGDGVMVLANLDVS